ncbi:hypothetical protein IWZ01DRAFT_353895 [Phyllosticta capitalensis]
MTDMKEKKEKGIKKKRLGQAIGLPPSQPTHIQTTHHQSTRQPSRQKFQRRQTSPSYLPLTDFIQPRYFVHTHPHTTHLPKELAHNARMVARRDTTAAAGTTPHHSPRVIRRGTPSRAPAAAANLDELDLIRTRPTTAPRAPLLAAIRILVVTPALATRLALPVAPRVAEAAEAEPVPVAVVWRCVATAAGGLEGHRECRRGRAVGPQPAAVERERPLLVAREVDVDALLDLDAAERGGGASGCGRGHGGGRGMRGDGVVGGFVVGGVVVVVPVVAALEVGQLAAGFARVMVVLVVVGVVAARDVGLEAVAREGFAEADGAGRGATGAALGRDRRYGTRGGRRVGRQRRDADVGAILAVGELLHLKVARLFRRRAHAAIGDGRVDGFAEAKAGATAGAHHVLLGTLCAAKVGGAPSHTAVVAAAASDCRQPRSMQYPSKVGFQSGGRGANNGQFGFDGGP